MKYSSRKETVKHIRQVRKNIFKIILLLLKRAFFHDRSKLEKHEKAGFDVYTPKLANCTYGSDEYKQFLEDLKPYLDHHYANNRHHPEHFENGIKDMNLVDIIEMFCDWYAATKRHNDGDILKSITLNQIRFGYSDDIKYILEKTAQNVLMPPEYWIKRDGTWKCRCPRCLNDAADYFEYCPFCKARLLPPKKRKKQ